MSCPFANRCVVFVLAMLPGGFVGAAEADWLVKYLPPQYEGGAPFTIKKVDVSRNHVDQEIMKADYERTPAIIRTLAREAKLVILPVGGGRIEVGVDPGIAISPQQSGTINGITDSLIDYRGKIPGGARAYIELAFANAVKKQEPVRVSNIFWIGSQDELKAAQKKDPADPGNKELKAIVLKNPPDDAVVPEGMPAKFMGGEHSFNGIVVEKGAAGQLVKLVVYFARPGGLYLPWYVTAKRSEVKIETAALEAAKSDATWFNDHLREIKTRIGQGNAPFTLKAVGDKVAKRDRIVWFGIHGLMGGEALENSADGRVKVRDTRFMQESVQEVSQLFVDREPAK